jgi:hypothetical protein
LKGLALEFSECRVLIKMSHKGSNLPQEIEEDDEFEDFETKGIFTI